MIDLSPFRNNEKTLSELSSGLTREDLIRFTNEIINSQLAAIATISNDDVVFVPRDPNANNSPDEAANETGWTISHVVVHTTASGEEGAARALSLARGVKIGERSRYETAWETVTTVQQCIMRLEESRQMRLAMLAAWPQQPNLDLTITIRPEWGELNAIALYLLALSHDQTHLGHLQQIVAQLETVRAERA